MKHILEFVFFVFAFIKKQNDDLKTILFTQKPFFYICILHHEVIL